MVSTVRPSAASGTPEAGNLYLNREISTLQFNERVLELAEDPLIPLLERCKFLAIVASNLDEFYMVRVAGLKRQQAAGVTTLSADGLSPTQQLSVIAREVGPLMERHARLFTNEVLPSLRREGIQILRWHELSHDQRRQMDAVFRERVFPILTPLAVDPAHPFPYISNRSLNLAVLVRDEAESRTHFARVKVPPLLPRFMPVMEGTTYVPLEDVIAANLDELFHGMEILERHAFRVTRDAELEMDDEGAEDLLSALEQELSRRRFSKAVRLEIESGMPRQLLELLTRELQVEEEDVYSLPGPLDLSSLMEMHAIDRPELKDTPLQPVNPPDLVADELPRDIFSVLREKDVLVHHPYESFTTSVQALIEQAAADPDVLAIKQTLYRTSGQSPIVDALIEAAESGKQVVVLVEIKARFDEVNNINWARTLEQSGCHVVYGLVGLKTHCKLLMIVRQEGDQLRRYVHVGTGNYNPTTARLYEDFGLLTSDENLTNDVADLFNYLTGHSRRASYASLIVAPHDTREKMIGMIDNEAESARNGKPGRIIMKLNALVDEAIIDALYEASKAGVKIDVICRGICALKPQVPGLSENIRVRSILGRYLEHSRVYYFGNRGADTVYIGSADMMHRNLDRRVEALVNVEAPELKERLINILTLALNDNLASWRLDSHGTWTRTAADPDEGSIDLHEELARIAGEA